MSTPAVPLGAPLPPKARPGQKSIWPLLVTVAVVFVALVGLFVAFVFWSVERSFRSSEPFSLAVNQAQHSRCVIAQFGAPVIAKGFIEGHLNLSNGDGSADLQIPIQGPNGKGSLHIEASRSEAVWHIDSLTAFTDDGQIHLLPEPPTCP